MLFVYNNNWHESQRANREEEKTYPTDPNPPNPSPSESQVPLSQGTPPTLAELLNGPPLLLPSHQPHDASTVCASSATSCPRPAFAVSHLCHYLKSERFVFLR